MVGRRMFTRRASWFAVAAAVMLVSLLAASVGSAARSATPGAPSIQIDPSISGTAAVGQTLKGDQGTWTGNPVIAYKNQWLRCNDSGEKCQAIAAATSLTYLVSSTDIGSTIRLRVTASNKQGEKYETSTPTGVVVDASGKPASKTPPEITGSAFVGSKLNATTGGWVGDKPITYSYAWQRCDKDGNACAAIGGATNAGYTIQKADAGKTIRIRVTAQNSRGKSHAFSTQTDVVQDVGGGENGVIDLPGGGKSVPVADVPKGERLIVQDVKFNPSVVTSRDRPIEVRVRVKDTKGNFVRGALVFLRSTPILTSTPTESPTGVDGWVTYFVQPRADFPLKNGYNVQFFVKAFRQGDDPLAGISASRLVQVPTRSS
jgi:hypothetical protein